MPTLLSGFWSNLDWDNWIYGLISAFIGGGSGAFSSGIGAALLAPQDFNIQHPSQLFKLMGFVFVLSGLQPFFAYLHQSGLPKAKVVTTVETVKVNPPDTTTKVTVEKTEVVPNQPPSTG